MINLVLLGQYKRFVESFGLGNPSSPIDTSLFEKFINYTILSEDDPDTFIGDQDLLDFVSVGGDGDMKLDGIGIRVNGHIVKNISEIDDIVSINKKISIEFDFIQTKTSPHFNTTEFYAYCSLLKHFFEEQTAFPMNDKLKVCKELKEYILTNDNVIMKLNELPTVHVYYVYTGDFEPNDHIESCQKVSQQDIAKIGQFSDIQVKIIDAQSLIKKCKELENDFYTTLTIKDIFPLSGGAHDKIKKAYAFTCDAVEFLNILKKEDGSIRRSLFNDNVRDYLGNSGNVNKEIVNTIKTDPEMFLLCNNGITIVCTDFDQIRDKLIRINNPQIVNGCQTCNSIYNERDNSNIEKVQLLVRLICTEDWNVANKVVRSTNKQNQVLDEAFETTRPYHEYLESYFKAVDDTEKLYYERRLKQYAYDSSIDKTRIVNLRILTQTFVAVFLKSPHEAHRHESILVKKYCDKNRCIYRENDEPQAYYVCALMWYKFEQYFRTNPNVKRYLTYKAHIYLLFALGIGKYPPAPMKGKAIVSYCKCLLERLSSNNFVAYANDTISRFDKIVEKWTCEGRSKYGIKDSLDFSKLILKTVVDKNGEMRNFDDPSWYDGTIFCIRIKNDHWYAFIKSDMFDENVYFDNRTYKGEFSNLVEGLHVKFTIIEFDSKIRAGEVVI